MHFLQLRMLKGIVISACRIKVQCYLGTMLDAGIPATQKAQVGRSLSTSIRDYPGQHSEIFVSKILLLYFCLSLFSLLNFKQYFNIKSFRVNVYSLPTLCVNVFWCPGVHVASSNQTGNILVAHVHYPVNKEKFWDKKCFGSGDVAYIAKCLSSTQSPPSPSSA